MTVADLTLSFHYTGCIFTGNVKIKMYKNLPLVLNVYGEGSLLKDENTWT
jgi:hypothetical protein